MQRYPLRQVDAKFELQAPEEELSIHLVDFHLQVLNPNTRCGYVRENVASPPLTGASKVNNIDNL